MRIFKPGLQIKRGSRVLFQKADALVDDEFGGLRRKINLVLPRGAVAGKDAVVVDAVRRRFWRGEVAVRAPTQMPLAEVAGAVAGFLKQSRHHRNSGIKKRRHSALQVQLRGRVVAVNTEA